PFGGPAGDNVAGRFNFDAAQAKAAKKIEIVVHLHRFNIDGHDYSVGHKADIAGVDLVDGSSNAVVRPKRPTLAIVPRGHQDDADNDKWYWDVLGKRKAFLDLLHDTLAWLADKVLELKGAILLP